MYIYDIITETFVEFYYRDLNTPTVSLLFSVYYNIIIISGNVSFRVV